MGGFGKSWRRIFHQKFYPEYVKNKGIHIGCHWECRDSNWLNIINSANLTTFLDELYEVCRNRLGSNPPSPMSWKETWHKTRVAIYSKVVNQSEAVELFHDETFKTTPAIGGRNPGDDRPTSVSYVWHRMLPIGNNQYLEIVTVFHGDRTPWKHQSKGDQLHPFIERLENKGLKLTWGKKPKVMKKII